MTTATPNVREISLNEIKRRYGSGPGRHWFEQSTMRFFGSRLPQAGYSGPGGIFFVSSEQRERYTERRFTIRILRGPGEIDTYGVFMGYPSRGTASRVARRLASGVDDA